jgi:hypothetical protein
MAVISLKWFGGMIPRAGERHLPPPHATEAENCNLYSGELRPLKKPALAHRFWQPLVVVDDPIVLPPIIVTLLYESAVAFSGFGSSALYINNSDTGVIDPLVYMINPIGHNGVYITLDGGETWAFNDFNPSGQTRYNQVMSFVGGWWWVNEYKIDNREHRLWFTQDPINGPWSHDIESFFALSYNHGNVVIPGQTYYSVDGNNNGDERLWKKTIGGGDVASVSNPGGGHSLWTHLRASGKVFCMWAIQGAQCISMHVWDDDATLTFRDTYTGIMMDGRTAVTNGATILSTGRVSYGGVTGNIVKIEHPNSGGMGADTFMDFGTPVEWPKPDYVNGQYIITAIDTNDLTKLRWGWGDTGESVGEITLPYPAYNDFYREVRYVGDGNYLLAYLATRSGVNNVLIVVKVNFQ